MRRSCVAALLAAGLGLCDSPWAAPPPSLVNYQGILRDSAGKPLTGSFDLLFSFWDHPTDANNQILTDFHTAAIAQGLLNLHLGSGVVSDGYGRGTYLLLSEVFRDYEAVWLQLDVGISGGLLETLSPRVQIVSAPFALRAGRADSAATAQLASSAEAAVTALSALTAQTATDAQALGGMSPSQFLDTTTGTQYKAGNLGLGIGEPASHRLTINSPNEDALRLIGPGTFGSLARLNFGDGDFVYVEEDADDNLTLHGAGRIAILGGNVGINTSVPSVRLEVAGKVKSSGSGGGFVFPDTTEQGTAAAGAFNRRTQQQIAMRQWGEWVTRSLPILQEPNITYDPMAFDGGSLWVAGENGGIGSAMVKKIRPSDGAVLATFNDSQADRFLHLAVDGQYVWAAGLGSTALHKANPVSGFFAAYELGFVPAGLLSDGFAVWATNNAGGIVRKTRASDGANLGSFPAGPDPRGIAFDGFSIWVASFDGTVTKLRSSDGAVLGTFTVPAGSTELVYDGSVIWVSSFSSDSVTRLRASDGVNLGTIAVQDGPKGMVFDGYHVWVLNLLERTVTKIRAGNGSIVAHIPLNGAPGILAFDGISIWTSTLSALWKY